jgi:hypothetical protein
MSQTANQTADLLAENFSGIFIRNENITHFDTGTDAVYIVAKTENIEVSKVSIEEKLATLDETKAMGVDNIPAIVLKNCAKEFAKPLELLFNKSLQEKSLPKVWKSAVITPIFKKGDKSNPSNYRPISVVPIIAKVLESIVLEALQAHLDAEGWKDHSQHGFVKRRSTSTNFMTFYKDVFSYLDNKTPVDIIYIDFEKTFDTVNHELLLQKLQRFGVSGMLFDWLSAYLKDRRFQVRVEEGRSHWQPVLSGVPQGSVLSPLLFSLYVSDMPVGVHTRNFKFADDLKLACPLTDEQAPIGIQQDLDKLSDWVTAWKLRINFDKCKIVHCGYGNPNLQYSLCNKTIQPAVAERDLGVIVDSQRKWSTQCEAVSKKANQRLGLLRRTFTSIPQDAFNIVFKTYIRPLLEYGNVLWSPYLAKDIDMLERVQRRATRLVPTCRNLSYPERLRKLHLPTLEQRRRRGDLIETYKVLHNMYDIDKEQLWDLRKDRRRGHSLTLYKQRSRLKRTSSFFTHRVVNEWNRLPEGVITAPNVNTFKNRFDKLNW